MARLTPVRSKVRLASWYNTTSGTDPKGATRLLRYVDAYNPKTGKYDIDVQRRVLDAGLGVWGDQHRERPGHRLPRGHCPGDDPAGGPVVPDPVRRRPGRLGGVVDPLRRRQRGDRGELRRDPRLQNTSSRDLPIAGWHLRDATHTMYKGGTYYRFPAGSAIRAKSVVTAFPGRGTDDPAHGRFFLQHTRKPVYPNVTNSASGYPGHTHLPAGPPGTTSARGRTTRAWPAGRAPAVGISAAQYRGSDEYVDIRTRPGVTTAAAEPDPGRGHQRRVEQGGQAGHRPAARADPARLRHPARHRRGPGHVLEPALRRRHVRGRR